MTDSAPAYRYDAASGLHLTGVPARDLTDDDVAALDPQARAELDANRRSERPAYTSPTSKPGPAPASASGPTPDNAAPAPLPSA
jgi:hypothetical protein